MKSFSEEVPGISNKFFIKTESQGFNTNKKLKNNTGGNKQRHG